MDDNFTFLATPADTGDNITSADPYDLLTNQNLIRLRQVIAVLYRYLLPFIIIMGLVGNLLSFLVFCCTYLRRMSSSVYLAAISVADFVFLLALLFNWINSLGIRLIHAEGWCQFFVYVTYVASFLSVWYTVCFTVERYLTVCFPFLRQRICQPKRTKVIVVVVAVLGLLVYSFSIWTTVVVQPYGCTVDERYYQVVLAITNVDMFVTLLVPGLVITVSNIRIAYSLSKFYRFYRRPTRRSAERLNRSSVSDSSTDNPSAIYSNSSYNRLQMKVTKMLLLVSSVFLFCNTPSHVIRVYAFSMSMVDPRYSPSNLLLLVQQLTMLLYYAGFSTNVILYNASGKTFRSAFVRLLRRLSHRIACRRCCCCCDSNLRNTDDRLQTRRGFRYQMRGGTDCAYS